MFNINWKKCIVALISLFPMLCMAALPSWQIVPSESSLSFAATQNDAPVTGQFKNFTGEISFDPNQLQSSHIKIVVNIASLSDVNSQISDTLATPDWFNVKLFPQAIYESTEFIKTGDKTFQVKGNLTLRDKTLPVTLVITKADYTATKDRITGTTIIKRTAFGVGQGDWADTDAVKDAVQVNFVVTALKK